MQTTTKIEHDIVLLGAGNANLQVVMWWGMEPIPATRLTLINETPVMPYSGMIPGAIAGHYERREIEIDVQRLCAVTGVRLILATATRIDTAQKQIHLKNRVPISYSLLSINIGSQPITPSFSGPPEKQLSLKPLHTLLDRIAAPIERASESSGPFPIVIVGGGASAFEIGLALRRRLADSTNVTFRLITRGERLLSGGPASVSRACTRALTQLDVDVQTGAGVCGGDRETLELQNGERIPYELCVWATAAAPLGIIEASEFEVDDRGFIRVHDNLITVTDNAVFAAGDSASLASKPNLPKAGVFSVRSGPVLWQNLQAKISGEPLELYRPQSLYLFLLNCGNGSAVMSYGSLAGRGGWAFKWKDFIDRGWMRKFHDTYSCGMQEATEMRCGGCGAKVGREILQRVLKRLEIPQHPDVVIGAGDDAAVVRLPDGKVQVQTVDFFRVFIDDPYLFGRIAATNALSDVYAMNAEPSTALAVINLPYAESAIVESDLYQTLAGALAVFTAGGIALAGGHTAEAEELQLGFCVTGHAAEEALFRKDGLRAGDTLILTKALGTGALLRAAMMGRCTAEWSDAVVETMIRSNALGAEIFARHDVRAVTDVTGFGLAGHLLEMLDAAQLNARLTAEIPTLPGFAAVTAEGIYSTLHPANAEFANRLTGDPPDILFDPQTSGGLLAGVATTAAEDIVSELRTAGFADAAIVGNVTKHKTDQAISFGGN
jgi:selenide,water dikinase